MVYQMKEVTMNCLKTTEDLVSAQILLDFFIELIETSKNLLRYYLSEDIVLDWFGQTIKGQKNVANFIKYNINPIKHILNDAKPVNRIGFRDTHTVRVSRPIRRMLRSAFLSPPRSSLPNTPVKEQPQPSTSSRRALFRRNIGSPDIQNNNIENTNKTPTSGSALVERLDTSPKKRRKGSPRDSDTETLEPESDFDNSDVMVKYLSAEGYVEFQRPSLKKLQSQTKWKRPCKLHVAYDSGKDVKDSTFYLIIYEGNVKCRKNLMKDFEAEEPES